MIYGRINPFTFEILFCLLATFLILSSFGAKAHVNNGQKCHSLLSDTEMTSDEKINVLVDRVQVTFIYGTDVGHKPRALQSDFVAAVEQAVKLLKLLLPVFPRSQPVTIHLSASGHGGVFIPHADLAAPLSISGSVIQEALPSDRSHSILKHEIGHMLLENRFFFDDRLPSRVHGFAELQAMEFEEKRARDAWESALWPMRFQSLEAGFSGYSQPKGMSKIEFETRLKEMTNARKRWDQLRAMRDARAAALAKFSNEPHVNDYSMKVAAAVLYSRRFSAFTEFFANLVARLFETHPGDFDRTIAFQARDQVHYALAHDRSLERTQRNAFPLRDAIHKNIRRLRMLWGFSGFMTSDPLWVEEIAELEPSDFQHAVFAPLREWIGKNILPELVEDADKVAFIKIIYDVLVITFLRSGSIDEIKASEVHDINRIAIEELNKRWPR